MSGFRWTKLITHNKEKLSVKKKKKHVNTTYQPTQTHNFHLTHTHTHAMFYWKEVIRKDALSVLFFFSPGEGGGGGGGTKETRVRKLGKSSETEKRTTEREWEREKSCCIYNAWLTHFKDPPAKYTPTAWSLLCVGVCWPWCLMWTFTRLTLSKSVDSQHSPAPKVRAVTPACLLTSVKTNHAWRLSICSCCE